MMYPSLPQSFFVGECFDAYRILGAHPAQGPHGEEGWRFNVWPRCHRRGDLRRL